MTSMTMAGFFLQFTVPPPEFPSLKAHPGKSLHELILQEEVEQDQGNRYSCGGSPDLLRVLAGDRGVEVVQAQLHRPFAGVLHQVEKGAEEVVPTAHEGQNGHCGQDRPGEGQDDPEVDPQLPAAVNPGGVNEFVGYALHELLHQEDVVDADGGRDDQGAEMAHPTQAVHDHIGGDEKENPRDHQGGQHEVEQGVAPGEMQFREGVSGQRIEEQVQQGDAHCQDEGVTEKQGDL